MLTAVFTSSCPEMTMTSRAGQPLLNLAQHLLALAIGQGVVEGDEVGLLAKLVEAGPGRGKALHAVVGVLAQAVHQQLAIPLVVLNHKNLEG